MITGGSTLDPGFPTWGTMLREHGYHTRWLGKWHLTHRDNHWGAALGERYTADGMKTLIPLSWYGLCEALITTPASNSRWRVR